MEKKKNNCLNFLKGIACIGVIIGHCQFPSPYGKGIAFLFNFAVAIFFMISGYFAYYEKEEMIQNRLLKKMKHIFQLTVIAEVLYAIFAVLKQNLVMDLNPTDIIIKILVGTFFNGTVWFLYALFWSYVCLYGIDKTKSYQLFYKLAVGALLFHVILRSCVKSCEWYDVRMFRNFLLYGLPFVLLGNWIHRNKEVVCQKISNKQCILGVFLGMSLTVIEYLITRHLLDFYVGTIIMSSSMFLYAIKNPEEKINLLICIMGEQLSMYIYILHILVIEFVEKMGSRINIRFYEWIKPINAILFSILLACLCRFIFNRKSKKERVSYGKD